MSLESGKRSNASHSLPCELDCLTLEIACGNRIMQKVIRPHYLGIRKKDIEMIIWNLKFFIFCLIVKELAPYVLKPDRNMLDL